MELTRGLFVAIDGPKNVGKTSVLAGVQSLLQSSGLTALFTKEPTPHFRLDNEQQYSGNRLAELLAADRATHITETIQPGLETYDRVVTDRYISSSLVFQVLDGVPFSDVWTLNRNFVLPDLNIFLLADIPSLLRRRELRASQTRLEQSDPETETNLYRQTSDFMNAQGVKTLHVDNGDDKPESETAQMIAEAIINKTRSDDA